MKKDESKYHGLFKMCAGCSKKEKHANLENEQFYCKEKGDIVYGTTDATTCKSFDGKNVVDTTEKNNMKKKILTAVGLLLIAQNKLFAQQWAMDEAYDDWRDTSSDGFSLRPLWLILIIIIIVWFVKQFFKENKK